MFFHEIPRDHKSSAKYVKVQSAILSISHKQHQYELRDRVSLLARSLEHVGQYQMTAASIMRIHFRLHPEIRGIYHRNSSRDLRPTYSIIQSQPLIWESCNTHCTLVMCALSQ
jgi:hypothetical protein